MPLFGHLVTPESNWDRPLTVAHHSIVHKIRLVPNWSVNSGNSRFLTEKHLDRETEEVASPTLPNLLYNHTLITIINSD